MTAQPIPADFLLDASAEFACLRSDFIDAFARLELAVGRCLQKVGVPLDSRKCCFDQMVGLLSKAKPSAKLSKKHAEELGRLPDLCQPLQHLRASVVHGVMEIVQRDGASLALFRNTADVLDNLLVCYALTEADIRERIEALAAVTRTIGEITRPSSPPPRAQV